MKESRYFIKRLTSAEAESGNNNVHEIYIRLTNDFDYKSFFQSDGYLNDKNTRQIDFTATDITFESQPVEYNLRFIYYENSNGEKRIPSLKDIFDKRCVKAGDTVCLESRTVNGHTSFYISFNRNNQFVQSNDSLYYSERSGCVSQIELYKTLSISKREEVFAYFIANLEERTIGADQVKKYSHTYIPHVDKYVSQLEGFNTLFDVCTLLEHKKIAKIAAKDPDPDPNYAGAYQSCFNKYRRLLEELNSANCRIDLCDFGAQRIDRTASEETPILPLQQIYYGAPGTGKSHEINEQTEGEEVIRTTFHPDSDYSTFVGAYKPTTKEIEMRDVTGRVIRDAQGVAVTEDRIVYEFVEQAFLQSYINAWKAYAETPADKEAKKQYLVIEEINRGNCAQIFGDLFQLLDRNGSGFSEYPIKADNDMKKQLMKAFSGLSVAKADEINTLYKGKDIVKQVLNGECLLLPNNLYIWATMNTSDQSLFPIDSAFKRRWDWRYMPIDTAKESWRLRVNGTDYSWTSFLNTINGIVHEKTQSEDKQLGFYFCKAKGGVVDAETFVGKVLFYLWNDVFKDYGFDDEFFVDEKLPDGSFKPLAFKSFYDVKTLKVIESQAEKFLKNLGIEIIDSNSEDDEDEETEGGLHRHLKSVIFSDGTEYTNDNYTRAEIYINSLEKIGLDKVEPIMNAEPLPFHRLNCPLVSMKAYDEVLNSKRNKYTQLGEYYIISTIMDDTKINVLQLIKDKYNLDYEIVFD